MWIKTKARWPIAIVLLLAWWFTCWHATGAWFDDEAQKAYRTESARAERFVADEVPGYNRILRTHSGVLRVLARDPDILRTLARFGPEPPPPPANEEERRRLWSADPDLAQTSRLLEVSARELGFDAIVLLDANGDCVAASNASSVRSIVGASYGDRDDFLSARAGRSGYLVSVGKRMASIGVSFYAPVIDHGRFVGVVGGGNAMAPFVNLIDQADAFLSDRNGVVLLARDSSLMLHALPGAPVSRLDAAARQALYHRKELTTLDFAPWGNKRFPELLRVPGRVAPAILRSGSVADGGLTVSVLWPMPQLVVLTQQRVIYAGALGVIGTLLLLLVAVYVTRRREQRVMALALAEREQTATDSRNFLDQIVNAIADPIFVKDREHRWVLLNQAFCNIFGQPREHFIGKSAPDVFPEREARRMRDIDERVLTAGIESINEEKLTDSQGRTHIVVTKKAPYTDANGQRFIVGTVSDITERKQMERLLRAREQEFRSLAENLPVAVIRYDSECRRRYLNRAAERMLHGNAAELLGHVPGGGSVPATPAMIEHYRSKMEEVLATDTARELDFVLDALPADQQERYEVLFVPEHGADGKTFGVLAIWYDITERKQMELSLKESEARYRDNSNLLKSIFESPSRMYIYALDRDYRYLAFNSKFHDAAKRAWGADIVVGMSMLEAIDAEGHREFCREGFDQVLAGRSFSLGSKEAVLKNGVTTHEYHDNYGSPIRNDKGEIVGLTIFAINITERKRLENELKQRETEFRALAENLPDPVFRYDRDCRRIYVNPAAARVSGTPTGQLIGNMPADSAAVKPDSAARTMAAIREVFATGERRSLFVEYISGDGSTSEYQGLLVPEFDADGQVASVLAIAHEVTSLRAAEQRAASFFANVPGFAFTFRISPEGCLCYTFASRGVEEIYGLMPEDVRDDAAPLLALAHPDDRPRIEAAIAEAVRTRQPFQFEARVQRPGLSVRWIECRSMSERQADGEVLWHGITLDITERKRMEQQLRLKEFALDQANDAIYLMDTNTRFVYVNDEACRALGYRRDELLDLTPSDIDPDYSQEAALVHRERTLTEGSFTFETRYRRRDGSLFPVEIRTSMLEHQGQMFGMTLARDITERKSMNDALRKREEEFRALAENSPDPIYRYDRDCHRLYVNPVVSKIIGRPVSELIGSSPADGAILVPEQTQNLMDNIRHVFNSAAATHIDLNYIAQDGQSRSYDMLLVPECNNAGDVMTVLAIARDITERKQHEATLRKQQELLTQAQRSAHVGSWEFDHITHAHSWSDELFRIFEFDPNQQAACYEACLNVIHPEDRQAVDRAYRDAIATRTPYEHEHRLLFADGRVKHVHERSNTDYAADGLPLRTEGMLQDITGRKLAEHSLEDARNRLLSVLRTMPDLVWLKDAQGTYLACNPMFERFFGAAEAQIVGKTDYDFVDAQLADFFREKDRQAMEAGRICINDEEVVFADDGHKAVLETRKVPMHDADGKVIGVLGVGRDITEHKRLQAKIAQRENEFRTLIENSPDTVVRFDRQCRRIYCNPAILKLTGYRLADIMGKTIIESSPYPLEFSKALTALVQKVMDTGQPGDMELYWEKMGTPVYLQFRVSPEFDQAGQVVSALSIGRDVTALKLAQERLRKSHDILRALVAHQETEHEKERQDLAYQIHEDLAQNLAALRLNISLFEMSGEPAKHAHLLKTMSAIADRSIVRIRDMVSMLRPTVLDLGLVPALQWLTDDFEGVGFQFELALQEDILLNDEAAIFLFRATREALINIALHAAATHVHLFLDSVTGVCRLVVRDNGCGFDPAAPRREGSFGLIGLTEQARHLGGDLVIDSTWGQGTSFEVQVPAFRTTTPHLLPDFSGATPI